MEFSEFVQVLSLWFIVLVFLKPATSGMGDGPLGTVIGIFAVVLLLAIPLFLLCQVMSLWLDS